MRIGEEDATFSRPFLFLYMAVAEIYFGTSVEDSCVTFSFPILFCVLLLV